MVDFFFQFPAFLLFRYDDTDFMTAIKRGTPTPTEMVMIAKSEESFNNTLPYLKNLYNGTQKNSKKQGDGVVVKVKDDLLVSFMVTPMTKASCFEI